MARFGIAAAWLAGLTFAGCGAAAAQTGRAAQDLIAVPSGSTVLVLPPAAASFDPTPPELATVRRALADMDRFLAAPVPEPEQMFRALLGRLQAGTLGQDSVIVTTITAHDGACEQTIRYAAPPTDRPVGLQVSQTGKGCERLMQAQPTDSVGPRPPEVLRHGPLRARPRVWAIKSGIEPLLHIRWPSI